MLGLPVSTEVMRQLPKAAIYRKCNVSPKEQQLIDREVSRLDVTNEISGKTTSFSTDGKVQAFFIVKIQLKRLDYDADVLARLMSLIDQRCIFALSLFGRTSLACCYCKLFTADWKPESQATLSLSGIKIEDAWENALASIIGVEHNEVTGLEFQVRRKMKLDDMNSQLFRLKDKEKKEIQPRRKQELHSEVLQLEDKIEDMRNDPLKG